MKKTILIFIFFFVTTIIIGSDCKETRETLRGLNKFFIDIEMTNIKGISEAQIRTDAELKLRLAGINVADESTDATLYIGLSVSECVDHYFVFSSYIGVWQRAILPRFTDNKNRVFVETWSTGSYGLIDDIKSLRDSMKENIDIFLNAYLSVNSK